MKSGLNEAIQISYVRKNTAKQKSLDYYIFNEYVLFKYHFQAYAAGCNIVILASTFERVQIIPGATHNYIRISALDCSTDTGKIAAAYEDKVCIFEPTPLIHSQSSPAHGLEYR